METADRIDVSAGPDSLVALVDDIGGAERARARRAMAVVELLLSGAFRADGAATMASWLTHHARMSRGAAGRLLAEGRFLHRYPAVAAAAAAHSPAVRVWRPRL